MTTDELDNALLDVRLRICAEQGYSPWTMSLNYNVPLSRAASVYWQTQHDYRHKRINKEPEVKWHRA